jgi:hypothetical protein
VSQSFGRITANQDVIYPRYDPTKFVGRGWLVDEVARFRDSHERQHLVIVGEPGSGKSTFIAYLAETWNCPRHFIRADNVAGVTGVDPRAFLISLGAQLCQKYGPEIFEQGESTKTRVIVGLAKDQSEVVGRLIEEMYTLPFLPQPEREVQVQVVAATGRSRVVGEHVKRMINVTLALDELTLLHIAVIQPLNKIQQLYPDERVILFIDALDESLQHPGRGILDVIPSAVDQDFPDNLRLVMTSRPGNYLARFSNEDQLRLDDKEAGYWKETLKDTRDYINKRLSEEFLAAALADMPPKKREAFVGEIEKRSDGNFLYLYYFMNAVSESLKEGDTDLGKIIVPADLNEIYRFFALERIRKNPLDLIHLNVEGTVPENLQAQLKVIEGVEKVVVTSKEATIITKDIDPVLPRLFELTSAANLKISGLQTQRGTQLGTWEEKYLPVLGVLAVAFEALSRHQIAGFAGVEVEYVDSIIAQLLQFLDTVNINSSVCYRLYHRDFADYLLNDTRNSDWPLDGPAYNYQIASYYLGKHKTWSEVDWQNVKETYPFQHLTAHLEQAHAPPQDLYALICESWIRGWEALGRGHAGFLDDIERAWRRAESVPPPIAGEDIAMQIKCALCRSSVAALSKNVPPELLALGLQHGVLTPMQALDIVRQIPDEYQHREALLRLTPDLPTEVGEEALRAVRNVKEKRGRARALTDLAPRLEEELKTEAVQEALTAVQGISDEDQETVLTTLAPLLPDGLMSDALMVAGKIADQHRRAVTLVKLSPYLPQELKLSAVQQAVEAARVIKDEWAQADALIELIPNLPEEVRTQVAQETLAMTRNLPEWDLYRSPRASAIANLAPNLPEVLKAEAREIALAINNKTARAWALTSLAPYLPEESKGQVVQEAFAAAQAIEEVQLQVDALISLALHLPDELQEKALQKALAAAQAIKVSDLQADALVSLAPLLPDELRVKALQKALVAAQSIEDVELRPMMLTELAPLLPDELVGNALAAALAEDGWARAVVLASLAPRLSDKLLGEALEAAKNIDDEVQKVSALASLAPHLRDSLKNQVLRNALEVARHISSVRWREDALAALAPHMTEELLSEVLAAERAIGVYALVSLAQHLPEKMKAEATKEAMSAARAIGDGDRRADALVGLAPFLPEELLMDALEEMKAIGDERVKEWALTRLATHFPPTGRLLEEALEAARSIGDGEIKARALTRLAPYLPEGLKTQVVQEAMSIARQLPVLGWRKSPRSAALVSLAPHVPEGLKAQVVLEALEVAQAIRNNEQRRAFALEKLVSHLPEGQQRAEIVKETLIAARASGYAVTLAGVSGRLASYMSEESLRETLELAGTYFDYELGAEVLSDIAPYLPEELMMEAQSIAQAIEDEDYRIAAIAGLAPHLPEGQRAKAIQDALRAVLAIRHDWLRAMALASLAPNLPGGLKAEAIQEALEAVLAIRNQDQRKEAMIALASHLPDWAQAHPGPAFSSWKETLREFSNQPRSAFLPNLRALLPFALALVADGEQKKAADRIFRAIQDVWAWWP